MSLGVNGTPTKYATVSQGAAATTIDVNKKFHGQGSDSVEAAELIITIAGGGDNTPSAGAVELSVVYAEQSALPDA